MSSLVAQPPAVTPPRQNKPLRPAREVPTIDGNVLDDVADRVTVAALLGFDVRYASALDGRVEVADPSRTRDYFTAIREAMVAVAGRVLHPDSHRDQDVARCEEIANSVCLTQREAEAFLALCCERVAAMASVPKFWDARIELGQQIVNRGGHATDVFRAPRTDPIVIEPVFNITTPAPVVNIAPPEPAPAPVVNVSVPDRDKLVEFLRDGDGQIVEAITSNAAEAR